MAFGQQAAEVGIPLGVLANSTARWPSVVSSAPRIGRKPCCFASSMNLIAPYNPFVSVNRHCRHTLSLCRDTEFFKRRHAAHRRIIRMDMQMYERCGRHRKVFPHETARSPNFMRRRSSARESRWCAGLRQRFRFLEERQLLSRRPQAIDPKGHALQPDASPEATSKQAVSTG